MERADAPAPRHGLLTLPDGDQIYYEDTGGPGTPMFFVYGLGCSIMHWKYTRQFFAESKRQIWFDFRGHGSSPGFHGTLRINTIVEDIIYLCEHLEVSRAVFLGQSMGGCLCLSLAEQRPDLVGAQVLIGSPSRDPAPFLPLGLPMQAAWHALIHANQSLPFVFKGLHKLADSYRKIEKSDDIPHDILHPTWLLLRELIRYNGFNPELAKTEDINEYVHHLLDVNPKLFLDLAADLRHFDIADFQGKIQAPTLVITGRHDMVIPVEEAERIVSYIPESKLVILEHGSHCPHFDDPGKVNREIASFIETWDVDQEKCQPRISGE